jgi:hypothetical protein
MAEILQHPFEVQAAQINSKSVICGHQALECDRLAKEDRTQLLRKLGMQDYLTLERDVCYACPCDVAHTRVS